MTITPRPAVRASFLPSDRSNVDWATYAKCLAAGGGRLGEALQIAKQRQVGERVIALLEKTALGAGSSADADFGSVLADPDVQGGFMNFLKPSSAFFAMLPSFVKIDFRTAFGSVAVGASAWSVTEGGAIPLTRLELEKPRLEPILVAGIAAISREVAASKASWSQGVLAQALREAIGHEADDAFFAAIGGSPAESFVASGADAAAMRSDILELLFAVNRPGARLAFAMDHKTASRASVIDDPRAAMSPVGGSLFGVDAFVSPALAEGTMVLVDASSIAAAAEGLEIDASSQADLEMSDTPTNAATPTATSMVSSFQTNLVSVRAKIRIGMERLRDGAVATLTGVAWGSTSP